MEKILVIEDDLGISTSLKLYLENSGFIVEVHNSGKGAINKIKLFDPDLIILDINLPEIDGMEICKQTRDFTDTPIIMLTARSSENDKIIGLELGADDYIAKPFSPRELLARIKRILKRTKTEKQESDKIIFENIILYLDKKVVEVDGKIINLTKNEYDILEKILKENGKIVSRETLMTEVIGYEKYVYDRTLDTHIKNIRKKLGNPNIILTVRGEGYRLNN